MMDTTLASAMKGQTMASAGEGLGTGPSAPHPFAPAETGSTAPSLIAKAEADLETPGVSTED